MKRILLLLITNLFLGFGLYAMKNLNLLFSTANENFAVMEGYLSGSCS